MRPECVILDAVGERESPRPSRGDPFPAFYAALEKRQLADLRFPEVRRALQALSSLYVERRDRLPHGAALEGAGKRAAFALYYAPLHFLLVRGVVRGLGERLASPRHIVDLGCGTGTAGAAWALEATPAARVEGVDTSGWACAETRWSLQQLGLRGEARRADAGRVDLPGQGAGIIAAFTVNELGDGARRTLLARLLAAAEAGSPLLVVEPIARRMSPWWDGWASAFQRAGGREDEWRLRAELPPTLGLLARAAGLDARTLTARTLSLRGRDVVRRAREASERPGMG